MKKLFVSVAMLVFATQAYGQTDVTSAAAYYPSCMAANDIVQGKRPAADSEAASKQLRQAAICFGAARAIMGLESVFKPEFSACPPADTKPLLDRMVVVITAYIKSHPDQLQNNFHQLAVTALAAAWPCTK